MQLNHLIDHTLLKPTALVQDMEQLCSEAIAHQFAAVCVPPPFVKIARELVAGSGVKVATVIGFPFGYSAVEAKIAESVLAMVDGADELDVVASILAIKNHDWTYIANEIGHLLPVIRSKQKVIKVIIESGVLTDDEIVTCCDIYGAAGIDFLKTSTGYADRGATIEAVQLFRKHLPASVKIKASGGIRTYDQACQMVTAGADRLGCSASVAIVQEKTTDSTDY
ncbi:MAG: deoxyribose-phosphate aldolase [Bacteroidota bacterium]